MHFMIKHTGQSMNKVIWNTYFSKKRLIFPNIKNVNVLIRKITQQKLAKESNDPKTYIHNNINYQGKYVLKQN